jgi:hypothetical protein
MNSLTLEGFGRALELADRDGRLRVGVSTENKGVAILLETLHDFERGIRDWQEVQDLLPDPLGTFTKGNPWRER